jgi:hypothetical protein
MDLPPFSLKFHIFIGFFSCHFLLLLGNLMKSSQKLYFEEVVNTKVIDIYLVIF